MSDNLPPEELVKALRMYVAIRPGGGENKMRVLKNPQGPQAAALIERLEARVAELEGALKPFADGYEERRKAYIRRYQDAHIGATNFDAMPDNWPLDHPKFNMGTYRKASKSLAQGEG
jgi:hypothetical protein